MVGPSPCGVSSIAGFACSRRGKGDLNYMLVVQLVWPGCRLSGRDTPGSVLARGIGTRFTTGIDQSANAPHSTDAAVRAARPGGEYFAAPGVGPQRRYEALRAYLLDGQPAATVTERFGYTITGLHSAVRDFRAGARDFFTDPRSGPKQAPGKDAAGPGSSSYAPRATRSTRSPRC